MLLPAEMETKEDPFARAKEHTRIRRVIRARYERFLDTLDDYSYAAYLSGEDEGFIATSARRMEARRRAKETLEREREKARREEVAGV